MQVREIAQTTIDCELRKSAVNNNVAQLKQKIQLGGDANSADENGHTAAMLAAKYGNKNTLNYLLTIGAKIFSVYERQPSLINEDVFTLALLGRQLDSIDVLTNFFKKNRRIYTDGGAEIKALKTSLLLHIPDKATELFFPEALMRLSAIFEGKDLEEFIAESLVCFSLEGSTSFNAFMERISANLNLTALRKQMHNDYNWFTEQQFSEAMRLLDAYLENKERMLLKNAGGK